MPKQAYDKKCIALAQLETSLRLFAEEGDLFSVITLAGAAEEILGKLVKSRGADNSLASLTKAAMEMHQHLFHESIDGKVLADRANRARNALKHLHAGGSPTITLDLDEEARDLVNRAIDNYWLLEASLTPAMQRFVRRDQDEKYMAQEGE